MDLFSWSFTLSQPQQLAFLKESDFTTIFAKARQHPSQESSNSSTANCQNPITLSQGQSPVLCYPCFCKDHGVRILRIKQGAGYTYTVCECTVCNFE
jgi:hypothetical protein